MKNNIAYAAISITATLLLFLGFVTATLMIDAHVKEQRFTTEAGFDK